MGRVEGVPIWTGAVVAGGLEGRRILQRLAAVFPSEFGCEIAGTHEGHDAVS
jgi:hypothetical protein